MRWRSGESAHDGPRTSSSAVALVASPRAPVAVVLLAFVASRLGAVALGLRFDAAGIDYASQLVDPEVLREGLGESLWYLQSQPPAFNALVGVVLVWSPFPAAATLQVVYLALGLALVLGLFELGQLLGLGRWWAAGIAIVVGCGPVVVLYESWLAYEHPVAVLLVLMVVAGGRWARDGSVSALGAAVALAALACLTRSLLHPVWFVAIVVLLLVVRRPERWRTGVVVALALPTFVLVSVMVKNQLVFGSPELSSWLGYNIHRVTVDTLSADTRQRLVDDGVLTAPREPPPCDVEHDDVPVLAEELKRSWRGDQGIRNFNSECTARYFDDLQRDAVAAARAEPAHAAKTVLGSFEIWAGPATFYPGIDPNRRELDRVETVYRRTVLLDLAWEPPIAVPAAWGIAVSAPDQQLHLSLTIVLATGLVVVGGVVALLRWRDPAGRSSSRAALILGAATVGYVTLAGNLLEHGENNRFRYIVEPLTLVLAAALVAHLVRRWRARRSPPSSRTRPRADQSAPAHHLRSSEVAGAELRVLEPSRIGSPGS